MSFSYFEYSFLFLPAVIVVYFLLSGRGHLALARAWLLLCSLLFYVYLSPLYLPLLLLSIAVNFALGKAVTPGASPRTPLSRKAMAGIGIVFNVGLLGYFKYSDFFIQNFNSLFGKNLELLKILAPLGISYYTFLQVAFLVDSYRGKVRENGLLPYALFVAFFPKIIQGPIALQSEIVPQLNDPGRARFDPGNFARGLLFFSLGLVKKLAIADNLAVWANQGYDHAAALTLFEAWFTMLAFCFQLYFDFSGYTDMAIGAGLMLNIRIPDNFNSPYKSLSMQDLWRRWHITLGRFLRDYVYIPLGGNRVGPIRTYANIMVTFLIGGFWHGAAWTFILWGAMNGLGLVVHRFWNRLGLRMGRFPAWLITFLYWNITVVMWRATSYRDAVKVYRGILGLDGVILPGSLKKLPLLSKTGVAFGPWLANLGHKQEHYIYLIAASAALCFFFKNSQELAEKLKPTVAWSLFVALLLGIGIVHMTRVSEFIYANF